MEACPHKVIRLVPEHYGEAAGPPYLSFKESYCRMCTEFPCVTSCPEAAFDLEASSRVGVATVDGDRCWSSLGQFCDYCERECRRHQNAIQVSMGSAPQIDGAKCDGCGRCECFCPVPGKPAIRVAAIKK